MPEAMTGCQADIFPALPAKKSRWLTVGSGGSIRVLAAQVVGTRRLAVPKRGDHLLFWFTTSLRGLPEVLVTSTEKMPGTVAVWIAMASRLAMSSVIKK